MDNDQSKDISLSINWFPGHMAKALRTIEAELKVVDVIIYVLDSRAPFSCVNPKLNSVIADKKIIYAFNKYDLADENKITAWIGYFSKFGKCLRLNSTESGAGKKVEKAIREVCVDKIQRLKQKNVTATLRAMVIGVPNCGKSTLINNLCNKAKTETGNRPGVTKGKQWVRIASGIELVDMPGTLWPAFTNSHVAKHLAYIGAIKDEVLDIPSLSLEFIKDITRYYPGVLQNKYKIDITNDDTPLDILEKICIARKFLLKRGELDYDRGSQSLITDFRQNRIGNITLDDLNNLKELTCQDIRQKR